VRAYILLFALTFSSANPVAAEDWTTTDGMNYKNVRVVRVEDDAITIIYKDGGALIPIFKLPPDLQERFSYNPIKAKAAADARSKADAQNAKELQAEIELAEKMKRQQQIKDAQPTTNSLAK
jgi:hypothetical protein